MYQHQQLRWEVAQDNQGNQPTNQNTNQQPNSQQQGQQSKQNKQPTIRFITAGKRQDQNDENPGGNMIFTTELNDIIFSCYFYYYFAFYELLSYSNQCPLLQRDIMKIYRGQYTFYKTSLQ
ncbi:Hypothetical_protein [Hexamita inflata]|uniref:Hypothetical_protein n=1 Tax=Hexamita inflata TaxID=28002 RepID=A0AA86THK6_9EUKA|nr:Hypothetical protein HINF_LOCUS6434 [Hexamita inflata]